MKTARRWITAAVLAAGLAGLGGGAWADTRPGASCRLLEDAVKPFDPRGDLSGFSAREQESVRAYLNHATGQGQDLPATLFIRISDTFLGVEGSWVIIAPSPACPDGCIGTTVTRPDSATFAFTPFWYRYTRIYDPEKFPMKHGLPPGQTVSSSFVLLSADKLELIYIENKWIVPKGRKVYFAEDAHRVQAIGSTVRKLSPGQSRSESRLRRFMPCLKGGWDDPEGFGFWTPGMRRAEERRKPVEQQDESACRI